MVGAQKNHYAKVVKPRQAAKLINLGRRMNHLHNGAFIVPNLLDWNAMTGLTIWSELPGISLNELMKSGNGADANLNYGPEDLEGDKPVTAVQRGMRLAGKALRELHRLAYHDEFSTHHASDEILLLRKWIAKLQRISPRFYELCCQSAPAVFEDLRKKESKMVLIHRDFYDKQVFISPNGSVGILDFDTLCTGEAALDLANVLVHVELRRVQRLCTEERAARAAKALLEGYDPHPEIYRRLNSYADASRLRLACVYSTRPQESEAARAMLRQIGRPIIWHTD
jgi:aminoglycoside phosphotransferase